MYCGYPQSYHGGGAGYLWHNYINSGDEHHQPVYQAAGHAGRGVDVFAEKERYFAD